MINAELGMCFLSDEEDNEKKVNKEPKKSSYKPESERVYRQTRKKKTNENVIKTETINNINNVNLTSVDESYNIKIVDTKHKFPINEDEKINLNLSELENVSTPNKTNHLPDEKLEYKIEYNKVITVREFDQEKYYGNIEYKLKLINKTKERIQGLVTQMEFRLREGHGTCFYEIGVEDNGNALGLNEEELKMSLETLHLMTIQIEAEMNIVNFIQGKEGLIAEIMVKKKEVMDVQCKPEIRIGLIGEEGSGKSTLVGCLISGLNDNGKGLTRHNVFRFKHEIKCGKTSSLSHQILGFDDRGKVINHNSFGISSWANIVENSVKIINFFDMGGSEKYLKTTVKTLSKNYLDYIILMIPANKGITNTTCDFLKIALSMNLPIVTVFTKIDLIDEDDFGDLLFNFKTILKKEKKGKNLLIAKNMNDIVTFSRNINEGILPVFLISNTKGKGMDLFKNFLNILPVKEEINIYENNLSKNSKNNIQNILNPFNNKNNETQFDILDIITHKENEKIIIFVGIVTKGHLLKGNYYKLGPDQNGNFKIVEIVSLHCKKIDVKTASQGQFVSIILDQNVTKENVRSGMVLLNSSSNPTATRAFEAEVWSIDSQEEEIKKIKFTLQPIVHISPIRQSVRMWEHYKEEENQIKFYNEKEEFNISMNSITKLFFEFMYQPEFIREGSHILIYENNFKIFGYVTRIIK